MKHLLVISALLFSILISSFGQLPRIVLVATGGTIAGSGESSATAGYKSGVASVDQMLQSVPDINKIATVSGIQFCNIGSQDMNFATLIGLAKQINTLLERDDVDGVVVTHGTDTMEESSFFLSLTVKSTKPVVMVGAMRPASALSAEGPLNLYNGIAVAASPQSAGHGVVVVMNDYIYDPQSLIKMHTSSVQAFQAPEKGAAGRVVYGDVHFYSSNNRRHGASSQFSVDAVTDLPRVDVIFGCTGMPADLIDASVKLGARGIVIAGVGNGNMSAAALEACRQAVEKGVVVVRASRVATGAVGRNVEIDDDALGLVASDELNPAKARVLLSLLLIEKHSLGEIQEAFYNY